MAVTVDKGAATVQIHYYPPALAEAPEIVEDLYGSDYGNKLKPHR